MHTRFSLLQRGKKPPKVQGFRRLTVPFLEGTLPRGCLLLGCSPAPASPIPEQHLWVVRVHLDRSRDVTSNRAWGRGAHSRGEPENRSRVRKGRQLQQELAGLTPEELPPLSLHRPAAAVGIADLHPPQAHFCTHGFPGTRRRALGTCSRTAQRKHIPSEPTCLLSLSPLPCCPSCPQGRRGPLATQSIRGSSF